MNDSAVSGSLSSAQMDGLVVDRNHVDYDKYRRIWNALADRRPAAIVRARTVEDVKKTVQIAAKQNALLAVRSGGHSLPGLSTCDDGIVLDLSLMNDVEVDAAAGIAEVGGGALLGDLDAAGARAGLVTPAGVISHTGVAGLTLGGGMGWLSRRFGLTIDNLLGAEVVTADGRVIWASAESEPDLFWGLRGGGGNFGVVTRFKFRVHPLGPIVVGCWTYSANDCEAVLHGFNRLSVRSATRTDHQLRFHFRRNCSDCMLVRRREGRGGGSRTLWKTGFAVVRLIRQHGLCRSAKKDSTSRRPGASAITPRADFWKKLMIRQSAA